MEFYFDHRSFNNASLFIRFRQQRFIPIKTNIGTYVILSLHAPKVVIPSNRIRPTKSKQYTRHRISEMSNNISSFPQQCINLDLNYPHKYSSSSLNETMNRMLLADGKLRFLISSIFTINSTFAGWFSEYTNGALLFKDFKFAVSVFGEFADFEPCNIRAKQHWFRASFPPSIKPITKFPR